MIGRVPCLWRRYALALAAVAVLAVAGPVVLLHLWPLPSRLSEAPSTLVEYRDGTPAFVFLSPDDRYRMAIEPAELAWKGRAIGRSRGGEIGSAIDPDYLEALLRFEDKRFARHAGIDQFAVLRALWLNLRHQRVVSGASTLTLQLARVLEPRPRSLSSKLYEALRAVQIEARMSKSEILAAYLTFIPFGRNLEGVRAASWAYFGHGPEELSPAEIATLLAVPQKPSRRYPSAGNAASLRAARDEVAARLIDQGALDSGDDGDAIDPAALLRQIESTSPPREIRALPRAAPHLAFWLRARDPSARRYPTTLDRGLQRLVEARMIEAGRELQPLGIGAGAAVVVDHTSGAVRAIAGSFDFWEDRHGAQIAGFAVARSPGSALKPFLYALAIDAGLALPENLVLDLPVHYAGYAPENYDGDFVGLISLEEALSHSLNVPFVRLLAGLGVDRFVAALRDAGVTSLSKELGYYGLSAAIGSIEVTPLEVAGLYTALAHGGAFRPLRWLRDADDSVPETPWLSEGASYLTRRALARRDRPDFPERRRMSGAPARVHWKTGTSYGHRDAWAAGSGPENTVVVWLGNFDQRPAYDLVGSEAAGPLLFDLLEAVEDRRRSQVATAGGLPRDLKPIEVCAYSGYRPAAACPTRKAALALREHVPTERCPYHVEVDVDLATGLALNPSCRAGRSYETRVYRTWPDRLRRYLEREQKWWTAPPPLDPSCRPAGATQRLAFLSPPDGHVMFLIPGLPPDRQEVPFEVESGGLDSRLSWFVDGRFAGKTNAGERFWWTPQPGDHEVMAIADTGAKVERRLVVREARSGL